MLGGANERVVLFASVLFSTLSLASNLWGGMATEKKRAELALEVGPRVFSLLFLLSFTFWFSL